MLSVVLPVFLLGNRRRLRRHRRGGGPSDPAAHHRTRFAHAGSKSRGPPERCGRGSPRCGSRPIAPGRIWRAVIDAVEEPAPATQLLVLEAKASADEAAVTGTESACGPAAGRRSRATGDRAAVPRCARRHGHGANHRSRPRVHRPRAVRHGAVRMEQPVIVGAVLYDPKVSRDLGHHPRVLRAARLSDGRRVLHQLRAAGGGAAGGAHRHRLELAARLAGCAAPLRRHVPGHRHARHRPRPRLAPRGAGATARIDRSPDLRGQDVAVGAKDSPQATLIPLGLLARTGWSRADFEVRRFDVLVGKHGDHIGGELEAFRLPARGEADACAMLDLNWDAWTEDGTIDPARYPHPRHDRPLRPLRLHGPRGLSRGAERMARGAVLDELRRTRSTAR